MKRVSRILMVLGLMAMSLPLFLTSASAASVTYTGLGEGLWVTGNDGQGAQAMVQNTTDGKTWCVEYNAWIFPGDVLEKITIPEGVGGALTLENAKTIYRIMINSYPQENPAFELDGTIDEKAASIQSAIWSFSNPGWEPERFPGVNLPVVISNFDKIRGWVDGDPSNGEFPAYEDYQPSITIDPTSKEGSSGDLVGPFTINLHAVSKVKVSATGGTVVDSLGVPIDPNYEYSNHEQFYLTRDEKGTATATVTGTSDAAPGSIYYAEGKQRLIAINDPAVVLSENVEAIFDPGEETTTTTSTSSPVEVEGTSVTSGETNTGVQVKGDSVTSASGTLATTGLNGISLTTFAMGFAMLLMGIALQSFKKLSEIHAQ